MTDEEFIGYCDLHCETPGALFSAEQINRIVQLAGLDIDPCPPGWHSMHEDMKRLVALARRRQRIKLVVNNGGA